MDKNLKTTVWLMVLVLLITNLSILGVYYQPRWDNINDCLKETAEKTCKEKHMEYSDSDGYPHKEYYFWCQGFRAFEYEFAEEQLNRCKEMK